LRIALPLAGMTAKPPQISALRESLGELARVLSMTLDCPTSKAIGKGSI
jgi:hypothetical protein